MKCIESMRDIFYGTRKLAQLTTKFNGYRVQLIVYRSLFRKKQFRLVWCDLVSDEVGSTISPFCHANGPKGSLAIGDIK